MTAIHQQKQEARREIIDNLKDYYRDLPREQLESMAVQFARIVASRMTLRELFDWRKRVRRAKAEEIEIEDEVKEVQI